MVLEVLLACYSQRREALLPTALWLVCYWILRLSWAFVNLTSDKLSLLNLSYILYNGDLKLLLAPCNLYETLVVGRTTVNLVIFLWWSFYFFNPQIRLNFKKRIIYSPLSRISWNPLPSWPYLPHALKCFCLLACVCACTYACCKFLRVHIYILVAVLPRSSERKQSWDNF